MLRVSRPWTVEDYERGVARARRPAPRPPRGARRYLATQRLLLGERGSRIPEVYLSVRLPGDGPRSAPRAAVRRRAASRLRLRRRPRDHQAPARALLDAGGEAAAAASRLCRRRPRRRPRAAVADPPRVLPRRRRARRSTSASRPQALVVDPDGDGGACPPLEADVLRLHESRSTIAARALRDRVRAGHEPPGVPVPRRAARGGDRSPARQAELMFAPLRARLRGRRDASARVRRQQRGAAAAPPAQVVDADQIAREESRGEHGPLRRGRRAPAARPRAGGRSSSGGDRPPLLRAALSLSVGAARRGRSSRNASSAAARVTARSSCTGPPASSAGSSSPPARPARLALPEYNEHLLPEQLGAMVPHATPRGRLASRPLHRAHAERLAPAGPLRPRRGLPAQPPADLPAGRQPRLGQDDLRSSCSSGRPSCRARPIVDIDPKGDHALDRLPGVADALETIELSADERYRGLLDPMRIGRPRRREDLAYNFLPRSCRRRSRPSGRPRSALAVSEAVAAAAPAALTCCGRSPNSRRHPRRSRRRRALEVHAGSGLARLGFARPRRRRCPRSASAQLISLRIRNLALPLPGTAARRAARGGAHRPRDPAPAGRLRAAPLRRRPRAATRCSRMDEAWALPPTPPAAALLERISRLGRSQNITPMLATQMLGDADELEPLVGASSPSASRPSARRAGAAACCGWTPTTTRCVQRLLGFRARPLLPARLRRPGRAGPDRPADRLLDALDTTPAAQPESALEEPAVATVARR